MNERKKYSSSLFQRFAAAAARGYTEAYLWKLWQAIVARVGLSFSVQDVAREAGVSYASVLPPFPHPGKLCWKLSMKQE